MPVRCRRSVSIALLLGVAAVMSAAACTRTPTASTSTKKAKTSTTIVTTTTSPFGVLKGIDSMTVGQCFDQLPAPKQQPYAVLVIPCAELHTYEVFELAKFGAPKAPTPGAAYPGDLVVANAADEQCVAGFQAFVGVEWAASHYEIQTWWPTQESWNAKNDRNIVCAVYKVDGGHTRGSAKGINN